MVGGLALGSIVGALSFRRDLSAKAICLGTAVVQLRSTGQCPSSDTRALRAESGGHAPPGRVVCSSNGTCVDVCFEAGTLVRTREGLVAIERVAVDTWVWARDTATGRDQACRVVACKQTSGQSTRGITLEREGRREVLRVTEEHPFWVEGRGWTPAAALEVGRLISAADGAPPAQVIAVDTTPRRATVFNIEVQGCHTYFVGALEVLVHNACAPKPGGAPNACTDPASDTVQALYQRHLARDAKPDEVEHWNKLQSSMDIEHEIAFSDEARRRQTIATWYDLYLGRPATREEITAWADEVATKKKTMEDVERCIALSQEAHDAQRPLPEMRGPKLAEQMGRPRQQLSTAERIALNERAAALFRSGVPQTEKDALAHALHQAGIFDGRITDQELPPEARPTYRRNEMASSQNLQAGASIRRQLDESARNLREAMIESAQQTRDSSLRSAAAAMSAPPSFDPREAFSKSVATATASDNAKGQMKRLGELLRARGMADDPQFSNYVDKKNLDDRIHAILQNQKLMDEISVLQAKARETTLQGDSYKKLVGYLQSEQFMHHLSLLDDAGAKAALERQLDKIALIDAQKARDILESIPQRAVRHWSVGLTSDDLINRLAALENALGGDGAALKETLKGVKGGADVAKRTSALVTTLESFKRLLQARSASDGAAEALRLLAEKPGLANTMVGKVFLMPIARAEKWGTISSGAALLGLAMSGIDAYNGKLFKWNVETVNSLTALMKTADAHDSFRKTFLLLRGKPLPTDCKVLTYRRLKFLGPVADLIGGSFDMVRSVVNFQEGNETRAAYQAMAGTGQLSSGLAGLRLLQLAAQGVTKVPMYLPATILASTLLLVAGKVGESNADRRPEVDYLRNAGLLAPLPASVRARRFFQERLDGANTQQFQAQQQVGKAALRLENTGPYDKARWEAAYSAWNDAKFALERAQMKVADRKKELDAADADLDKLRINPRDWEGMWPEDIAARGRVNDMFSQPHLLQGFMGK